MLIPDRDCPSWKEASAQRCKKGEATEVVHEGNKEQMVNNKLRPEMWFTCAPCLAITKDPVIDTMKYANLFRRIGMTLRMPSLLVYRRRPFRTSPPYSHLSQSP